MPQIKHPGITCMGSVVDDMDITPNALRLYFHILRCSFDSDTNRPTKREMSKHCFSILTDDPEEQYEFYRYAVNELYELGLIYDPEPTFDEELWASAFGEDGDE